MPLKLNHAVKTAVLLTLAHLPNYTLDYSRQRSVNVNAMRETLLRQPTLHRTNLREAPLLSMKDTGKRLGIGRDTLYRLIGQNKLRTIRIGRRRLVTPWAIEEYIDAEELLSKKGGNYGI